MDVTTSKDECTWTRLTSVVFTRKRPFTEEQLVLNDTKLILDHIGRSLGLLAGERAIRGFTRNIIVRFIPYRHRNKCHLKDRNIAHGCQSKIYINEVLTLRRL